MDEARQTFEKIAKMKDEKKITVEGPDIGDGVRQLTKKAAELTLPKQISPPCETLWVKSRSYWLLLKKRKSF